MFGGPELELGVRRLGALVWGLPKDSATFRALYPAAADWAALEELAAFQAELLHESNRLTTALIKALVGKKGQSIKVPPPLAVPRPGGEPAKKTPKRKATAEELVAFLGAGR